MKKVTNLKDGANIFVVLGQVGSGKTALTLGHPGKKLVVSFDGSYSTLAGHEDEITVVEPETADYGNADKFVTEIDEMAKDVDLVVFDNISAVETTMVEAITDGKLGNNTDGRAAYGKLQKFLAKLSRWAIHYKGDVLFTLWSQVMENGASEPAMNAKAFNSVAGYAKLVSRTVTGFDGYQVVVNPDGNGTIKNRMAGAITKQEIANADYWKAIEYAKGK
ncbi:NTP-binding helicase [Pediococcus phage cIP1]|uniref:Helicase (NTP-binding) n=2 Tax=Coetzeevirus TaxID=1623300 RepID=K4I082_9CAUD|nr:NTP-binding helicase [Pediococcus phage cIP1]YP_007236712.1 helicase (NTP-binding) [Lactobacillus phage ATCC8014]AER59802.1 NTP-binding helicase [Pediococcus phage cIP1]AFU63033.1 helicase (NTP-binding) [Lactobacillus phage ATCC8014]